MHGDGKPITSTPFSTGSRECVHNSTSECQWTDAASFRDHELRFVPGSCMKEYLQLGLVKRIEERIRSGSCCEMLRRRVGRKNAGMGAQPLRIRSPNGVVVDASASV